MDSEYTHNSCGSELAREEALPDATNIQTAEELLQQSLTIARAQGALAWELRSATSLAQLWQRQSRYREALDLLCPVYQRFTEGYATPDLRKVRLLIAALREHEHA
jgi:predicted ATPase